MIGQTNKQTDTHTEIKTLYIDYPVFSGCLDVANAYSENCCQNRLNPGTTSKTINAKPIGTIS